MNSLVSVIIPTYNRAELLSRAIKSVLNQTYKYFELIIVDDGSVDNTKKIVEEFQKQDSRIIYIYQKNQGLPSALNMGLSLAKGNYIAFLESDDEWLPEKLEKQIEVFKNYLSIGLVICWAFRVFENNNKKLFKTYKGVLKKKNWCIFFKTKGIISPSTIKKEVFKTIGFLDNKLKTVADLDLYIRIVNKFDLYFMPVPLVYYHESLESLSKKNFWVKWIPELEYILEKHKNIINDCDVLKYYLFKTLGTSCLLNKEYRKAREYFYNCIKFKPLKIKLYFQYFLSFSPSIYKNLLFLKRKFF